MKKLLMYLVVALSFTATVSAQIYNTTEAIRSKLLGGRGYVVPFVDSNAGLSMAERGSLTNWTNKDRKAVWYLYQAKGAYNMGFKWTLTKNATRNFKITCTRADGTNFAPVSNEFSYTGLGKTDTLMVLNAINVPTTGYYRYELESKNTIGTITINELIFEGVALPGQAAATSAPHTTDYLSSPSVHFHYSQSQKTSKSNDYDWLYQEVMAPTGFTPTATYWEAIGFTGGYFGMQANSTTERRILFSIWDSGVDTDKYTKNGLPIPESCKDSLVSLVDKAEYTKANGFGGEGTGGQSYVGAGNFTTWRDSVPVKFLMNIRRDTIVSTVTGKKKPCLILTAWYKAYEEEGWRYVASWRRPFASAYFNESGSFLENFGWANGHLPRKGYYYNTFAHENSTGKWVHLNKNYGTHTDGATGQRNDYEHNVAPEDPTKFYMLTGGYGGRKGPNSNVSFQVPAIPIANFPTLDTLNLKPFTDRINSALAAEKAKMEEDAYLNSLTPKDKGKWILQSFSSQETSGESNGNGRAALIIDGNEETYWHSKWTGSGSSLPHRLVIDMTQSETIRQFKFVQSGGSNRWTKGLQIETSDDNANWSTVFDADVPEAMSFFLILERDYTFRYFRLTVKSNFSDPPHTRLNEIYAYGQNIPTAIQAVSAALHVYPNPTADAVTVPLPINGSKNVTILLKDMNGKLLSKHTVRDGASEHRISLTKYPTGTYFIQTLTAESAAVHKVIKK